MQLTIVQTLRTQKVQGSISFHVPQHPQSQMFKIRPLFLSTHQMSYFLLLVRTTPSPHTDNGITGNGMLAKYYVAVLLDNRSFWVMTRLKKNDILFVFWRFGGMTTFFYYKRISSLRFIYVLLFFLKFCNFIYHVKK